MFDNIPLELRQYRQWVVWRYEMVRGRQTKVPFSPTTGHNADITNTSHWGTFAEAVNAFNTRMFTGIGFVFSDNDPYTGIDIDDKDTDPATPEERKAHQKILEHFNSYTERSPGGRGYHIIIRGKIPLPQTGRDARHVGVYSRQRYFTMTGEVHNPAPIGDYNELLQALLAEMPETQTAELVDRHSVLDDEDLFRMAITAANGDKFDALCKGDMSGYPSQSEADFALLSIIAYYTPDNEQVRRVFRMSALGRREKATQNDVYLDRALSKIRAKQAPPVDTSALLDNAAKIVEHVPRGTPELERISLPRGLVGELAVYFYQTAIRPVPEIALAAALSFVAGICARSYNISGTGLNQYIILLARTGSGKEGALAAMENMIAAVRTQIPQADQFIGPAAFASGQALIRVLDERPCFVSVLGEFGLTLQEISDNRANSAQKMLKKVLLDLYTKSGWNRFLRSSVYSDTEKNTKVVQAPNVSIFGESTPETFFEGLSSSHVAEGLIPRFSVIEYTGDRPPRNRNANVPPEPHLVDKVASLITTSLTVSNNNACAPVQLDPKAQEILDAFDTEADGVMNASKMEVEVQLWNRSHLKALKLAALLAVGVNPQQPVVTADLAEWAIAFVRRDVAVMTKRFQQGDVGQGDSKQHNDLKRTIVGYYQAAFPSVGKYGVPEALHAAKIIPYTYLARRTAAVASFRNDRLGATSALRKAIQDMLDSGMLIEIARNQLSEKYGFSGAAYGVSRTFSFDNV